MYVYATFCYLLWSSHHINTVFSRWKIIIKAITEAPNPENKKELRSFLGLVNYYHRFVPNISRILSPLYELTMDNAAWEWNNKHENTFVQAKKEIASDRVLAHHDPNLPVHVQ